MTSLSADERDALRRKRRPYLWTAGALFVSVALVAAAWIVDQRRPPDGPKGGVRRGTVTDLVTPSPLSDRERSGSGPTFGSQESVKLEEGAWVQVADAQGNLKQQYTATRIDPLPDKRFAMQQPRAVMYSEGGRIVTMRSDTMTARMPRRALESGRLDGNVVIRVFRAKEGRPVDLATDAPDMVVESPEAQFDMASGEIRCDRKVKISGDALTFEGEGLSLSLSQDGKSVERLVVDRPLAPVRFSRTVAMAQDAQRKKERAAAAAAAASGTKPGGAPPAGEKPAKQGNTIDQQNGAKPEGEAPALQAAGAKPGVGPEAGKGAKPKGAVAGGAGGGAAAAAPGTPAARGKPAAPPPTAAELAAAKDGRLFLLTLNDNVEVTSTEAGRTTVITGDQLQAYFMMRSGKNSALAAGDPFGLPERAPVLVAAAYGPPALQLLGAAVAAAPDDDIVEVRYTGRLVMAPAPEGSVALAQPRNVRVIVTGQPARVRDSKTEAVITAQRMRFETGVERMDLQGTDQAPATVESPKFALSTKHFALDRSTGDGLCDGPGTLRLGATGAKPMAVSWSTSMTLKLAPLPQASAPGAPGAGGGAVATGAMPGAATPARQPGSGSAEGSLRRAEFLGDVVAKRSDFELTAATLTVDSEPAEKKDCPRRIVATGGVKVSDLSPTGKRFEAERVEVTLLPDANGDAQPRSLLAVGDVRGADLAENGGRFEADRLDVQLAADAQGKAQPRSLVATGKVRASAVGSKEGHFEAERLDVTFTPDAEGAAQPRTLLATGGVMAADRTQTIWASSLRLAFVDRAPRASRPARAAAEANPGAGDDAKLKAAVSDVSSIVAEGPVELLMPDGGRVYAERMEGDGIARSARLFGPDVMVIRGNLVLDQLAEVRVQEEPARVNALGAGRASAFTASVAPEGRARTGRPRISAVPQMQATWRESLAYADGAVKATAQAPARGLLLLQGSVKVRASRDAREAEALDADEVQMELIGNPAGRTRTAAAPPTGASRPAGPTQPKDATQAKDASQQVGKMRANGSVRLEARQWADAKRAGDPKLFRLNAPNIAYDAAEGSAFVDGAGTLLVHDPPVTGAPVRPEDGRSPFSPDGTTRFAWKRSLALARRPDATSTITLEKEVVMEHLGAAAAGTGTVTADRMIATVHGVEGTAERKPEDVGMSLGGPAELTKVFADGHVVVRTAQLDIDAGEFELDVPSQVGAVRAVVGRLVTVMQRGETAPMRAHAFTWDLVKGTFRVEGARGTVGR